MDKYVDGIIKPCKSCGERFFAARTKGMDTADGFRARCDECNVGSICWDCSNAYPLLCAWVGRLLPVWDEAKDITLRVSLSKREGGGGKGLPAKKILRCSHYAQDPPTTRKQKNGSR